MRMRRMKAVILTIVFLLVTVSTAYASFTDIEGNPHKEAIEEMARLGILEGVGNNLFAPDVELNRAAAAKVAAYLLGYTEEDALAAAEWEPMFDDVYIGMGQHEWAVGWINLVASEGVIEGYPGGEYRPGDELQMVHWAAILTRILEHVEDGMEWPEGYNQMAEGLGLTANMTYIGSKIVNRAEMAQMTTNAIFDVKRPDGKRIIDIVEFKIHEEQHEEDFDGEEVVHKSTGLSVSISKKQLPAGGGQTTEIVATVIDSDNSPVEGVYVSFFASQRMEDRSHQLSADNVVTDSKGMATVTYTTLAVDDNKHIGIRAVKQVGDDEWFEKDIYILASNEASSCEGRIINPFNGESHYNTSISINNMNNQYYFLFENVVDENGYYSILAPPGDYHITFELDLEDANYYSGSYTGSHHNFKSDNTMELRIQKNIGANQSYTLESETGILKGVVSNLGSHKELYIVREGDGRTVIADVNSDGSFIIALPEGNYEINAYGGHILKSRVKVEKGKVTDLGSFSR